MNVYPFMLYSEDHNFNCPKCGKVFFEKYWVAKYTFSQWEPIFTLICRKCHTNICLTIIDDKLYVWCLQWFNEWFKQEYSDLLRLKKVWRLLLLPKNKITNQNINFLNNNNVKIMSKKINIEAHVKRYDGVSINDKLRLIEALNQSIEDDKIKLRETLQRKINILDQGGIPDDEEEVVHASDSEEETAPEALETDEVFPDNIGDLDTELQPATTGKRKRK